MNRILILIIIFTQSCTMEKQMLKEPKAKKIDTILTSHGHDRIDRYYWMSERDNPDVLNYLRQENDYRNNFMSDYKNLEDKIFSEIKNRIKDDDSSVPYYDNGYFYYTRFEKEKQYPIYCRKKNLKSKEEVLIDVNIFSKGFEYYRVGSIDISPDNKIMAYSYDTLSRRLYTIKFINLETGKEIGKSITNTSGGVSWANDNKTVFYDKKNIETLRNEKVFNFNLYNGQAQQVFFEEDETFNLNSYKTKSGKYIVISSSKTISDEYWILNANEPNKKFKLFQSRVDGLEFSISHANDKWLIRTNTDNSENFKIMTCDEGKTEISDWTEYIKHRKSVYVEGVEVFKDFYVLVERENGERRFKVISIDDNSHYFIDFDEEVIAISPSVNADINNKKFRFNYSSLTTPNSVIDFNLLTREKTVLKENEVLDKNFKKENYESKLVMATARDGKKVPISLVYKKSLFQYGKNPLLLYGYGSYGSTINPRFNSVRLSILDRGFVYAIAHIRGSQYLGRNWYEEGKMFNKKNTFWDFIDCGKFLAESNYADENNLYAMGGSAGGLLMGAVMNMEPGLFKGIVAGVPFVDVVTTMLDDDIPLTTFEYDEWGNPNNKDSYEYMLSYSPYDQVAEKDYPALFITTGYHDSQVQYFEPAKWIAKLREKRTNKEPLLMYCNMDAGHGGASGRYEAYKETAMEYAFLIAMTERK